MGTLLLVMLMRVEMDILLARGIHHVTAATPTVSATSSSSADASSDPALG